MASWESQRVFVDTNILFYALDRDAAAKHTRASTAIEAIWSARNGVISTQVLAEWAVNLRRKLDLDWGEIDRVLHPYLAWNVVTLEPGDPLEALAVAQRCSLSYWDSLIVLAAKKGQAQAILTEDMNPGQVVEGIEIINPL